MKCIVFLALFAIANAGFLDLRHTAQPLVDKAVSEFTAAVSRHPLKLHTALKAKRDLTIAKLERELQTDLGNNLQDQLQQVLDQIQDAIDHGQNVAQSLVDKAKELTDKIKELGGNVVQLGQQFLQTLLEHGSNLIGNLLGSLGIGKRDFLGDLMGGLNGVVTQLLDQLDLGNLLQNLLNSILGGLGKKRDLISDLLGGLLNQVLGGIDLSSIPIVGDLLGLLGIGKRDVSPRIWNHIVDTMSQIWNALTDKFTDFKDWVHQVANESLNVAQGHIQNIKELAQQFIGHTNEMTSNTIQQALEFFEPYHNDLGSLWTQIQEAAGNIHQQITG